MEKLILKAKVKKTNQVLRKPLMASVEIYDLVQELSDELGYRKGFIVDDLLRFALDHVVVNDQPSSEEEDDDE